MVSLITKLIDYIFLQRGSYDLQYAREKNLERWNKLNSANDTNFLDIGFDSECSSSFNFIFVVNPETANEPVESGARATQNPAFAPNEINSDVSESSLTQNLGNRNASPNKSPTRRTSMCASDADSDPFNYTYVVNPDPEEDSEQLKTDPITLEFADPLPTNSCLTLDDSTAENDDVSETSFKFTFVVNHDPQDICEQTHFSALEYVDPIPSVEENLDLFPKLPQFSEDNMHLEFNDNYKRNGQKLNASPELENVSA